MHGRYLFEYAVIRIVPRVEREEFLNAGVIVYCREQRFLQSIFTLDEQKLLHFFSELDIDLIKKHLCAFQQIALGYKMGGPIALLDIASRFRWLTATRSTVVQTSKVHPGLCRSPEEMLQRLYKEMVL